jgi:hypothetical protein
MAKRIRYKIGDVFLINLTDELKGAGRVLKKDDDTVFIELFRIKPFKWVADFDYVIASREESTLMIWCYDDHLKNGEWEIIDNIHVEPNFPMPNFWNHSADGKYYLIPGSDTSFGDDTNIRVISEQETKYAQRYGIHSPLNVPYHYTKKLKELNLL